MIREYIPADADEIARIWGAANALAHPFLTEAFVAQEAENLRNIYLPNAETWVIEQDGSPVGFIALIGAEIGGLFLLPSLHGQGLGKALLDHARGLKGPLTVEVFRRNAIGRKFYNRQNFVETERYLHEPTSEDVIRMALS